MTWLADSDFPRWCLTDERSEFLLSRDMSMYSLRFFAPVMWTSLRMRSRFRWLLHLEKKWSIFWFWSYEFALTSIRKTKRNPSRCNLNTKSISPTSEIFLAWASGSRPSPRNSSPTALTDGSESLLILSLSSSGDMTSTRLAIHWSLWAVSQEVTLSGGSSTHDALRLSRLRSHLLTMTTTWKSTGLFWIV